MEEIIGKKVFLIIVEPHMEKCFELLEEKLPNVTKIYLNSKKNKTIIWKIFNSKKYFEILECNINELNIPKESIFIFSTGEGFEIANLKKWFPLKNKIIAIQHGMFILKYNIKLEMIRNILNGLFNLFLGFNIVGKGFGGTKFDKYLVYGEKYKNYLVENKKWNSSKVLQAGPLLKKVLKKEVKQTGKCILLLQSLVEVKFITQIKFEYYLKNIVEQLKLNFDSVIIRFHPKMQSIDYNFLLDEKIEISRNKKLEEDLEFVEVAFSFFSTALIDANLLNIPVVGIKIPEISDNYYEFLEKIVNYNNIIIEKKDYVSYKIKKNEFEYTINEKQIIEELQE